MEQVDTKTIVQQFKDWEIQILVLLSFALQLLLFFFGGLRRRTSRVWLRIFLWLTYLSADFIAVYALGYLSRHLPTTTNDHICCQTCPGKNLLPSQSQRHHDLTLLWAPFFLVHLGGQDTVTAFAIEDNELWSRHLLNMIVQYGERIWALKCGSQESLKSSTSSYVAALKKLLAHDEEDGSQVTKPASTVQRALKCMPGLREVFSRRQPSGNFSYEKSLDAQLTFKTAEIELSMMYDEIYTKAKVIQTGKGTILRCVSLTSTVVAFVLFILMSGSKQRYYNSIGVDVAITYTLFVGAFCLEACAIIIAMVSPRAWASMEARGGGCNSSLLTRAAYRSWSYILPSIHPEKRQWWSNSVGQYNLLSSCLADGKSRITEMMAIVGGKEVWSKFRHTRHDPVTDEMKELIHQEIDNNQLKKPLNLSPQLFYAQAAAAASFEVTLFMMHLYTDMYLYKVSRQLDTVRSSGMDDDIQEKEVHSLMHTCEVISDYMFFLLVTQPAMLPVQRNVYDLLALVLNDASYARTSSKEQFLEALASGEDPWDQPFMDDLFSATPDDMLQQLQQGWQGLHAALQVLIYAAGKSRPEEHARRLSMGGELLTFVWLFMAHRELGDIYNIQFQLVEKERRVSLYGSLFNNNHRHIYSFPFT
uniref:DUF4220 domain-containing protein n=1 Tax=Oryza meridionalis TaxID=40149 RepID=A0A0E0DQX2_9ORYZ